MVPILTQGPVDPHKRSLTKVLEGASFPLFCEITATKPRKWKMHQAAHLVLETTAPLSPPVTSYPTGRDRAEMIIAAGVVLTICYVARLVLITLLMAILLTFILAPLRDFLQRLHLPRSISSLLAVLLLLTFMCAATFYSYSQAVTFMQTLPKYSGEIREAIMRARARAETFQKTTTGVLEPDGEDRTTVTVRPAATPAWQALAQSLGSVSQVLVAISFIPFLVYFMLTWHHHVRSATVMLFRLENRHAAYVTLGLIARMMRSFMVGNLLVGLFLAAVSTAVFGLIHLPFFYFVGIFSGFLSLVPYLGGVLALAPPLMVGLGQISSGDALVIAVTVFMLHLFALNVLYPKLVGNRLQLNPLVVSLALLFWGWMWGGMGLVLAIPITGAMKIIFDHVESLQPYAVWLGE